jgi:hypothetical protein
VEILSTRIELPFSGNTICEIRKDSRKTILTFFKNNKQIGKKAFMGDITEDSLVDGLATAGVEFVTFSAVYDASSLILKTLVEIQESEEEKTQIFDTSQVEAAVSDSQAPGGAYRLPGNITGEKLGDLIFKWEIPYSHKTFLYVFRKKRQFQTLFIKNDQELYRAEIVGNLNEKRAYKIVDEANLDLVQLSSTAQIVEKLLDIVQSPQNYEVIATEKQIKSGNKDKKGTGPSVPVKQKKTEMEEVSSKEEEISLVGIPDDAGRLLDDNELPYSGGAKLQIFHNKISNDFTLIFLKGNAIIHIEKITEKIDSDRVSEMISSTEIEFVSMTVIYDIADYILEIMNNPGKYPKIKSTEEITNESQKIQTVSETAETETTRVETAESVLTEIEEVEIGDYIAELEIPYSHNTICKIFYNPDTSKFALSFWRDNQEVDQALADKKSTEDDLLNILSNAKIEFISMSVVYDAASEIQTIFEDPQKYVQARKIAQEKKTASQVSEEFGEVTSVQEEEEAPIDYSQYKKPEDIESLIEVVKKSLGTDRPIMVREGKITSLKDIGYRIFRQGESTWSMEFFNQKSNAILTQRPMKLKQVNFDEVFRVVNNGIPQITLSAVNDAAEGTYNDLKLVAERPADDLIFNQVINHFEKVINEYEENKDTKGAINLTEGLMRKLENLNNASGVAKFGTRLARLYEKQDKFPDSAKLRQKIFPDLLNSGDFQATREFLDDSLELFTNKLNRFLDAAQMSLEFGDRVLKKKKDLLLGLQYIKEASISYKKANLPVAQADHNLKYAKLYLQFLFGDEPVDYFEEDIVEEDSSDTVVKSAEKDSASFSFEENPFAMEVEEETVEDSREIYRKTDTKIESKTKKDKKKPSKEEDKFPGALRFDLRPESIQNIISTTVGLFQEALSIHELRKDRFEVLENITDIILLYRSYSLLDQEVIFARKGVDILAQYGQSDRALKLGIQMIDKLLKDVEYVTPALEFFNEVIKLYYAESNFLSSLQLSLTTVKRLIKFKEKETAQQYLNFTAGLLQRVFPKLTDESIDYYLKLAQGYQELGLAEDSMVHLKQVLKLKKKNTKELIGFCLDTERRFLKELNLKFAQDFINTALSEVGNKDLETILKIAEGFSIDLYNERQPQLSMQYLTYSYQIAQGMPDPLEKAGALIVRALERFLESQNVEAAIPYIESLIPIVQALYQQTKNWDQATKVFTKLVSALLFTRKTELKVKYTKELATYYYWNKELKNSSEALIRTRDKLLVESINDARELTDVAIQVVSELKEEGIKLAIEFLPPLIKQLAQDKNYNDAYVYTIKSAKFYENLKKVPECTEFLKDIRSIFEKHSQMEDAERLTSLMLRLNRKAGLMDVSEQIAVEYFKKMVDEKMWEYSYNYLTIAADISAKKKKYDEADKLLDWGYDIYIEQFDAQNEAEDLINEIIKFRKTVRKLKKQDELEFLRQSALRALDFKSLDLSNRLMSKVVLGTKETNPGALHTSLTVHLEKLISLEFFDATLPYLSDLLNIHVNNPTYLRDLLFYYIENYLKSNKPDLATRIVDTVLERLKSDLSILISITMRFIQSLVEYRFIETSKKYLDQAIANIFPEGANTQGEQLALASINQKFANMVFENAPEIAVEYSIQAADMFRIIRDYDKMIDTYLTVAKKSSDIDVSIRVLKRAQFQGEQVSLHIDKQIPIQRMLVLLQIESNSINAQKDFQEFLSKLEEKQDLKNTLEFLEEAFSRMIRGSLFDFFYKYVDYAMTIADHLKKSNHLKFFVRIAGQYYHRQGDKNRVKKLRDIFNAINEPDPTQEQLDYFWKQGEYILPTPKPKPIPEVEIKDPSIILGALKEETLPQETQTTSSTISEEEEDLDLDSLKEISSSLTAAISALNELSTKPEEVNIKDAPEVTSETIQDFHSSVVIPEESEIMKAAKSKEMSSPWGSKSHKALKEEMGGVVDELSGKLSTRDKAKSAKISILGSEEPSEKLWEDAQIEPIGTPIETLDTTPTKSDLSPDDYGDLFKDALSNLQSLISTISDPDEEDVRVDRTSPVNVEDQQDEEEDIDVESLLDSHTDVIQSLREDLLKDSKKNFDKKLDKESKSVKKKKPKFELTPPPTARHAISKGSGQLTSQEEEIYIDLTMAYRKLVSENEVYVANEKWQKILPEYLNRFGITAQEFEEISQVGDKDILLQDFIEKKIKE